MFFDQIFIHITQRPLTDVSGNYLVEDGEIKTGFTVNKILNGVLSKRSQLIPLEDMAEYRSVYVHNIRLEPKQISYSEIQAGDMLILVDSSNLAMGKIIIDSNIAKLQKTDGTIVNLITTNQQVFTVKAPYQETRPSRPREIWHIRCEVEKSNTSLYE